MKYSDGTAFLSHYFIRNAFMEPWKAFLPAEQVDSIFSLIEQKLNKIAVEHGELVMSVPYVCFNCFKH
jgi:hypothetical protein